MNKLRPLPKELRVQVDKAKEMILKHPNRKNRWASDYAQKFNLDVKICIRALWELDEEESENHEQEG